MGEMGNFSLKNSNIVFRESQEVWKRGYHALGVNSGIYVRTGQFDPPPRKIGLNRVNMQHFVLHFIVCTTFKWQLYTCKLNYYSESVGICLCDIWNFKTYFLPTLNMDNAVNSQQVALPETSNNEVKSSLTVEFVSLDIG